MTEQKEVVFSSSKYSDLIREFFKTFKERGKFKYLDKIDSLTGSNLQIDFFDLFDYDNENKSDFKLNEYFLNKTKEAIKNTKRAVKEIYQESKGSELAKKLELNIQIDKSELEISVSQAIKSKFVEKLVSIQARITGESEIKTRLLKGIWECNDKHSTESKTKPLRCFTKNCTLRDLELNKNESDFEYYRNYYLKDFTNVDHNADCLICEAQGDHIDSAKVGEVVNVTGFISVENNKNNNFFNILHLLNIKKVNEINYEITEQEKEIFRNKTKESGYWKKLVSSISPNVHNLRLLKTAFLLSYVGGSRWTKTQKYWINVLAVGDSSTAKTKVSEWAKNSLPNVSFVSSKSGSPKGLFAGQKEQIDGEKVLEVGPMITASGNGLVCIDEFVRSREIFDIFYTPMETGVFNSATVGGHADLPAETPIYATGNPKKSNKWDENKSILENLDVMERSLLSRFDLIVICKENSNTKERKSIAHSILCTDDEIQNDSSLLDEVSLVKLLLYAKTFKPTLTQQAKNVIVDTFQDIYSKKESELESEKYAETNYRFVGMMARVILAISKLHFHNETTEEDVSLSHSIVKEMYAQRGLITNLANTYVDRVAQMIQNILKESKEALTDSELYTRLFVRYSDKADMLRNDIGKDGSNRRNNKRWRAIMDSVEGSVMVEIQQKHPRKLIWLHDQRTLG